MIALKGANRDFFVFTISSLRRELSPTRTPKCPGCNRVQTTCNTSSAYHVQHVMCHVVRRDSSAIKFDRVKIAFIFAVFYWVKFLGHWPDLGPYAPQGSTPLLPKLSVTLKVSAPTSHAWVGSLVHFRSSEDVNRLEFTSPIDRE